MALGTGINTDMLGLGVVLPVLGNSQYHYCSGIIATAYANRNREEDKKRITTAAMLAATIRGRASRLSG